MPSVRLLIPLGLALVAPALPAQTSAPITLQRAIELAEQQGYAARSAKAAWDAARYRDRAFYSRLLPQISVGGTVPSYNRSIVGVTQPDGGTQFRPLNQTAADLTATLRQQLPLTGGNFYF
jgi:hypothetical protein